MNGDHKDDNVETFWDERPEEEDVFLPTEEPLRPVNMYLERAAWIGLQVGVYSPAFLEAVKRTLVHIHGGLRSSYRIEKTGRNKYLLVFQDEELRDVAVHERPYVIPALGAQFTLIAWQQTDGMQYHPPRYEAWVRLVGTPLHMWNNEGIHRITARMGTVKGTMPYGLHARQLEHITVHMATKHPRNIPKWLKTKMGEFDKPVRVKLLAWRQEEPSPFPPPPDQRGGQSARRPLQQHQQQQRPPSPNIHSYSSESSADSNWHPWAGQGGPFISQASLRKLKGVWIPKPKVFSTQPPNMVAQNKGNR